MKKKNEKRKSENKLVCFKDNLKKIRTTKLNRQKKFIQGKQEMKMK